MTRGAAGGGGGEGGGGGPACEWPALCRAIASEGPRRLAHFPGWLLALRARERHLCASVALDASPRGRWSASTDLSASTTRNCSGVWEGFRELAHRPPLLSRASRHHLFPPLSPGRHLFLPLPLGRHLASLLSPDTPSVCHRFQNANFLLRCGISAICFLQMHLNLIN